MTIKSDIGLTGIAVHDLRGPHGHSRIGSLHIASSRATVTLRVGKQTREFDLDDDELTDKIKAAAAQMLDAQAVLDGRAS